MCGIVGLYNWPVPRQGIGHHLEDMCKTIVSRGPDDEGYFVSEGIGLGMRRLSIIDVEGGHQPIYNEDKTIVIVFNGEIYNFQELRHSLEHLGHTFATHTDTEVIVHAYEEYGTECIKKLNGIFGFALWDAKAERLLLARDRMGVKPLYYAQVKDGLAFASEIKALLVLPDVRRVLNFNAAAQFFRLGFVPPPETLLQEIYKVPPGWYLLVERGRVSCHQFWDIQFHATKNKMSFQECAKELRQVLEQAVSQQMISDVPIGAFLSGGVDSSGVVALMQKFATQRVRTYSIGFEQEYSYHNEAPYAQAVADRLGTNHSTIIVRPNVVDLMPGLIERLDEPLTDTSFLVTFLVSQLAHRDVKVILSGVGGDELFAGYRRYLAPTFHRILSPIPNGIKRIIGRNVLKWVKADRGTTFGNLGRYVKALGNSLHLSQDQQYLRLISVLQAEQIKGLFHEQLFNDNTDAIIAGLFQKAPTLSSLDRLMYIDTKTVLPESLLLLTDRMGMATSVEIRVPFLDNDLVDFVSQVPDEYRLRGFTLKRLLKEALRGVVPDFVLTRSKRGFGTPMGVWLRTDLKSMVSDIFEEGRIKKIGIFNAKMLKEIHEAHNSKREDYSEAIFALLSFEIWREALQVKI